jgi:hypothetical protein
MYPRVVVVSFALTACSVDDKHAALPEPPSDVASVSELNVGLTVVDATGAAVADNSFALAEDVHFTLHVVDPEQPVVAEDYVFQVIGPDGSLLSSDDRTCRRFHVNTQGVIDGVHPASLATGAACTHAFERTSDRALRVQAMPFAIGSSSFILEIAPLAHAMSDGRLAGAVAVAFDVDASSPGDEPSPPEQDDDDDDGNGGGGGNGSGGNGNGNGSGKK